MNKKHQSKLEDIENEVDSFKKKKQKVYTPKFKKIEVNQSAAWDLSDKSHIDWDAEWDNIEVPTLRKLPKSKIPLTAKITLVVMVFIIGVLLLA